MSAAARLPRRQMTVDAFRAWDPGDGTGERWVLRDGEPELMAPPSERHGLIQARLAQLLMNHFDVRDSQCRAVTNAGVIPHLRSAHNMLSPDIAVTCDPDLARHEVAKPVVLIEILSPSNESETRANIWAFATVPSVRELVIIDSVRIAAEVLRRGPDGTWPDDPELLGPDDSLRLDAIGFATPLRAAYRGTGLA
jgi:Uma2 family endonuclease